MPQMIDWVLNLTSVSSGFLYVALIASLYSPEFRLRSRRDVRETGTCKSEEPTDSYCFATHLLNNLTCHLRLVRTSD